jgi:starch phosphorylase
MWIAFSSRSRRVSVSLNTRRVLLRAWQRTVVGVSGASVPVIFLDIDLEENAPDDRALSHDLYGGDAAYRLAQEAVLGIGGVRMLRALGYSVIERFHLNEGHSALLTSELVAERLRSSARKTVTDEDCDAVRRLCVFTTHTPVSAALDRFPPALVEQVLASDTVVTAVASVLLRGRLEHDPPCPSLQPLHQRSGDAPRRSVAPDVRRIRD